MIQEPMIIWYLGYHVQNVEYEMTDYVNTSGGSRTLSTDTGGYGCCSCASHLTIMRSKRQLFRLSNAQRVSPASKTHARFHETVPFLQEARNPR